MKAKYRGCALCTHRPTLYKSQLRMNTAKNKENFEWRFSKFSFQKPILKNPIADIRKIYVLNLKSKNERLKNGFNVGMRIYNLTSSLNRDFLVLGPKLFYPE